jgi:hypothetical protein
MTASVVQRLDFDVERPRTPVAVLVLDAHIGKLDVAVLLRKLVLNGPAMDLLGRSIGPPVAVRLAAIPLLQKLLVLALQLVIEQHAADQRVVLAEALGLVEIGPIYL